MFVLIEFMYFCVYFEIKVTNEKIRNKKKIGPKKKISITITSQQQPPSPTKAKSLGNVMSRKTFNLNINMQLPALPGNQIAHTPPPPSVHPASAGPYGNATVLVEKKYRNRSSTASNRRKGTGFVVFCL